MKFATARTCSPRSGHSSTMRDHQRCGGGTAMAWQISGTGLGPCSCKVSCPCELGELVADQGWCSGVFAFDLRSGNVDGVDVSGTKVVFVGDWPSGFLSGNGKA